MDQYKIHVYFMPGMAANASIFENIRLPGEVFELHFLEWKIPKKNESLEEYAVRMNTLVKHPNAVLVGVSFGGILVQEMAKHIAVKKVIIISSVKLASELPRRMIFAKYTKVHKLLPTGMVNNIELMAKYAFGETATKRLKLYQQYLSVRDKYYLDWSIDQIVNWKQQGYDNKVVHIHGEKDPVFPITYIRDCVKVKNGTHTMIIHRAKWFNEHLPEIILQ
ncbi:Pimeloyl-ACP methyl ester carboxylesterase [Arenibacter nanhaiticus]|uniref:Pimeloyl-ACP methyl ester carboxylesterase n=1 Tax=Arenibacter nanhaiticus TaxID=558155 RepID=A0A1M6ECJ9_9FLAO|nr:alpha/beta hydrolase [Arenibacter nanhaiticus]SHI83038.1 Pimeloyl-ACP methyl ester carboxylesterase [Arenibacter nanhaiticus]